MDTLPREIIDAIVDKVIRPDLKNLRQVSKNISGPATYKLFSHIHVTSQWASQGRYNSIISSPEFSKCVKTMHFGADDGTYNLKSFEQHLEDDRQDSILEAVQDRIQGFKTVIKLSSNFHHFPNLHTVYLTFPSKVRARANSYLHQTQTPGTVEFQAEILTTLFITLFSIANLRSLAIQNLQNVNNESLTSSSDFHCVLGRLTELRLGIATEQPFSNVYTLPYLTTFFSQLPSTWLSHSPNLTSLALCCDQYWGYIYGCDFRTLHLPNLKKLELGTYAISHDSQLKWIASLSDTLEELVFKDVVILSYAYGLRDPDPEDEHNAIALSADTYDTTHAWVYPRSWVATFMEFKDELPKLKYFEMSSESEGRGVVENRYSAFYNYNDEPFTNLGRFVDSAVGQEYGELFEGELFDWRSVNREMDEKAYDELMAVVNSRA